MTNNIIYYDDGTAWDADNLIAFCRNTCMCGKTTGNYGDACPNCESSPCEYCESVVCPKSSG